MSGMRPTGELHLGHLVGVLTQWETYSENDDAFFEIADLHAYTTEFADPSMVRDSREAMVALAGGRSRPRAFDDISAVGGPGIAELQALLS